MARLIEAEKTLNRAYAELKQASDHEDYRQVAEKGWRAAREAVYGVMECHGQKPERTTLSVNAVADFESHVLGRPRESGRQVLADGYARAIGTLHGECFYQGDCPKKETLHEGVKAELNRVGALVDDAKRDMGACIVRRQRRR